MPDQAKAQPRSAITPPALGEPYLLTPGPLTTSARVKQQMLRDWGSWDDDFRQMTAQLRSELLALLDDAKSHYDCVPIQGSGTYAVEAMLGSFIPPSGKALVLVNGAYGQRIVKTLQTIGREYTVIDKGDYLPPRAPEVAQILADDAAITHVVVVHCETSSGILNPIEEIARAVSEARRELLIDSMSAFGALALDLNKVQCQAFVSSANKCIEGVPGFGFVIAKKSALKASKGNCHSLSLDVYDQWNHLEKTGQWRFTPPTHAVAAFIATLAQHQAEGAVAGRHARYTENRDVLVAGMRKLGFETLLQERWLSPIIVTFFSPSDPNFSFAQFYQLMKAQGFIIYPGKLTVVDSFRIGCIGHIDAQVMREAVTAVDTCLNKMQVKSAEPPQQALAERQVLLNLS